MDHLVYILTYMTTALPEESNEGTGQRSQCSRYTRLFITVYSVTLIHKTLSKHVHVGVIVNGNVPKRSPSILMLSL